MTCVVLGHITQDLVNKPHETQLQAMQMCMCQPQVPLLYSAEDRFWTWLPFAPAQYTKCHASANVPLGKWHNATEPGLVAMVHVSPWLVVIISTNLNV